MAILLRTGIIGLKDWLYQVGVLVGSPRCEYSWPRQTPKHVILSCPIYTNRKAMLLAASIENYNILLLIQKGLKVVTQQLISQNGGKPQQQRNQPKNCLIKQFDIGILLPALGNPIKPRRPICKAWGTTTGRKLPAGVTKVATQGN